MEVKMKYKTWASHWLKNYVEVLKKVTTWRCYESEIRLHINPSLGNLEIDDIQSKDIQQLITNLMSENNSITNKPLASSHVNLIISIIEESLSCYFKTTSTNQKEYYIKRPNQEHKEVKAFSINEEELFLQHILKNKKVKYYGFVLCSLTGLRLGELLALEWKDVDLDNLQINVTKTRSKGKDKNGMYTDTVSIPKSRSSIRKIPLTAFLVKLLHDIKSYSGGPYVISYKGRYQCIRSYQKMFSDLLQRLNIDNKCFHSTRHSFATRLLEYGTNPKIISEIMGHSNPNITLKHYDTCFLNEKRKDLELLSKKLTNFYNKKKTHIIMYYVSDYN